MKLVSIIGVSRGSKFSPNHIDNDAAIFNEVAKNLQRLGYNVNLYTEDNFIEKRVEGDIIFNMARSYAAITRLKKLELEGTVVINSAFGIDNCIRRSMTEFLIKNNIPHPKSHIISTQDKFPEEFFPCWIKRGDSHAIVKEDVCYVTSLRDAENVLEGFRRRNISVAVVNEHLKGDLIKFYGVQGTGFFYWFYPSPSLHSKFGLEIFNGEAQGIPFSEESLKCFCDKASLVLNVPIYGGDCVVSEDGSVRIIDFNDWPSFARCREEAGEKIADYIYSMVKHKIAK